MLEDDDSLELLPEEPFSSDDGPEEELLSEDAEEDAELEGSDVDVLEEDMDEDALEALLEVLDAEAPVLLLALLLVLLEDAPGITTVTLHDDKIIAAITAEAIAQQTARMPACFFFPICFSFTVSHLLMQSFPTSNHSIL